MKNAAAMNDPVISRVIQPPSGNFIQTVTQRIDAVRRKPIPFIARPDFHFPAEARSCHQCRHIPNCEKLKVRKTLIEYMLTRYRTEPPVMKSIRNPIPPMKYTPYFITSRSERWANRWG